MRIKILFVIVCLLPVLSLFGQDKVTIDMAGDKWYIVNDIEKKTVMLEKAPKELTIIFPTENFQNYQLQFFAVDAKEKLFLGFTCKDKGCIGLSLSDFTEQKMVLKINQGALVGIGNRVIEPRKITDDKGKVILTIIGPPKVSAAAKPEAVETAASFTSLCKDLGGVKQLKIPAETDRTIFDFLCRHYKKTDGKNDCGISFPAEYDYNYLLPCTDKKGNALTPTYHIIYFDRSLQGDPHLGSPYTILKLKKNKKEYEYYRKKKRFSPLAYRELALTIIGKKDSSYIASLNSTQLFMEYEGDFAKSLTGITTPKETAKTDEQTEAVTPIDTSKPVTPMNPSTELKYKLTDLIADLGEFNQLLYPTIDFVESRYEIERLCLIAKIAGIFEIEAPKTGEELANRLAEKIKNEKNILQQHYKELCGLIDEARLAFDAAVNKKSNYYVRTESMQIPNEDQVELSIKTKAGTELFKPKTYLVSGGFKIDFSTGIFHTGISAADFVTGSQLFRFKATRDTILPSGQDSVIYTGGVTDTTLNILRKNDKLSFGTGFFVHFYPRSGRNINVGGTGGVLVDNTGQAQFLLGGSLMFTAGKNRVALVAGWVRGREKTLSTEFQQSYWKGGDILYNSRYDLPKNYEGTNPPSYDKWKTSWFVGITFNFLSLPVAAGKTN